MDLPLAGLRVLDFSQFLAGPAAALRLADLGARVIKVERPGSGDGSRALGLGGVRVDGDGLAFHAANRNKESVAVDLSGPDGLARARGLIADADVLIENFRPGALDRLGLGDDAIRALNPQLVHARVTGYGGTGPWRDRPGQDLLVQAASGLVWLSGAAGDPPTPLGISAVDVTAGQHLVQGVLAALVRRGRTGRGALVEASLLEAALDLQGEVLTAYLNDGGRPPRRSATHPANPYVAAPYGVYPTADGWLALAMGDLARLAEVLDVPELAAYANEAAYDERDAAKRLIAGRVARSRTADLLDALLPAGFWAAEALTWDRMFAHDAVRALGMVVEVTRDNGASVRTIACPLRIDGERPAATRPAPRLNEHEEA